MTFDQDVYLYGRCHIFAIALQRVLQYPIEFFWDTEALFDDGKYVGQALIHAYVVNPLGQCIDASGVRTREEIEEDYDWNCPIFRPVTKEEVDVYMEGEFLDPPEEGELEFLTQYIEKHLPHYQ